MRKFKIIIIVCLTINSIIDVKAQCPTSKYSIVPVWTQGWSFTDKENRYQMMSNKGMGYSHSILTCPELEDIQSSGQVIFSSVDLKSLNEYQVDLSEQSKGIYFVKIKSGDFVNVRKIIIQ